MTDLQILFQQALERQQRGDLEGAAADYARILTHRPDSLSVLANLAGVFYQQGRFEEALELYDKALAVMPDHPELLLYRGFALRELDRAPDALAAFDAAIARNPHSIDAWTARGGVLQKTRRFEDALESYRRALALQPRDAEALNNSGIIHCELGDPLAALAALDAALRLAPASWQAHNNRGNALRDLGRLDAALESYGNALAHKPDYADAHYNRGDVLMSLRRYGEAAAAYADACAARPDLPYAQGALFNARMQLCDWDGYAPACAALLDQVDRGAATPFTLLLVPSTSRQQRKAAELYAARRYGDVPEPPAPHNHRRIRIGYVSASFRHHPVMLLAAELFERHDRTRFETFAFSLAPGDGSVLRTRLEAAPDHFIDAQALDDRAAADAIRNHEIDIAIDLDGFTLNARLGVLAHRPAPVQIGWLGYPGTLGAPFIDYILADPHVIPPGAEVGYRERVLRMPFSYQPNSARPSVAPATRAQAGLPQDSFVFCCFNNPGKITPDLFAVWMRLLAAVPASVLWLRADEEAARANLRAAAEAAAMDARRLIFAPAVPEADHFARLAAADLFLDTFPYNAHTTASDALWAGVPVVTRCGDTFVSRVAASLLQAVDLPELVTTGEQAYETLALELARTPARMMELRHKLAEARATAPLFDMARFTRDFEALLEGLCAR